MEQDEEWENNDTELQNVSKLTRPEQNVVWISRFVDSVADVASAMNVSGMAGWPIWFMADADSFRCCCDQRKWEFGWLFWWLAHPL